MEVFTLDKKVSLVHQLLAELRDKEKQKDRLRFRHNLTRLGEIMAYEISKTLDYDTANIETPQETVPHFILKQPPVLITILRAGVPFYQGFLRMFDQSPSGFIGAFRKEESQQSINIQLDYQALPPLSNRTVIVVDTMLATGKSMVDTLHVLMKKGMPHKIHLASVVAAPEGIERIVKEFGNTCYIWTAALDSHLNKEAFIVPGLGDAGDLSYGDKLT